MNELDWSPKQFFMTMAKLGVDADYIARQVDMRRMDVVGEKYHHNFYELFNEIYDRPPRK